MTAAPRQSLIQSLRNNFLTGLVVVAPIGITLYLTWTVVDYVDGTVLPQILPLIPEAYHPDHLLPFSLPGLGLLVFVAFLTFVGSLAKNFFGRELIRVGEGWVERMPVVRSIYNAVKQIAETVFAESGASFKTACLVEYPRKGIWSIAFIATEAKGEVSRRAGEAAGDEMLSVFLPSTPNPTTGFLLFVPRKDVIPLTMSVEEAAKLVISAGLISPPEHVAPQPDRPAPAPLETVVSETRARLPEPPPRPAGARPYSRRFAP